MTVLASVGGLVDGSLFKPPSWVDTSKPPGHTSQTVIYQSAWWHTFVTLKFFFLSPNLVWMAITLALYTVFPYNFEAATAWDGNWIAKRFVLNLAVTFGYFGFWHLATHATGWTKRKFNPSNTGPVASRLFHNVWFTLLGAAQWTVWEIMFLHMYAKGTVPYDTDAHVLSSLPAFFKTVLFCLLVPPWRETQFYFAHRLIHVRALYKFVHSLHHRNSDIEPFSGLCMHPIEHLYYFGCAAIVVYLRASPLVMMWLGIHAMISPAAGHSGWEDHWQSDQHHYIHHAKFECNYGTPGIPFDVWFGTFRDKLGASVAYHGSAADADIAACESEAKGGVGPKAVSNTASRNTYLAGGLTVAGALPHGQHALYYAFTVALAVVLFATTFDIHGAAAWHLPGLTLAQSMGALLSLGPILFGYVVGNIAGATAHVRVSRLLLLAVNGDAQSARWPFHKVVSHVPPISGAAFQCVSVQEAIFGQFGLHLIFGVIFAVVPVYHFVAAFFGDSVYSQIWSVAQ